MTLTKPYHSYGYCKAQRFYDFNLLSEIDQPGEWHPDRDAGVLYFWPPSAVDQGQATVSVLDNLVVLDKARHATLRGLIFEASRGKAITIQRASNNLVAGCLVHNVGGTAITRFKGRTAAPGERDHRHGPRRSQPPRRRPQNAQPCQTLRRG